MISMRITENAVKKFGAANQIMKFCQEVAECQEAVLKRAEGRDSLNHVAEEIADLEIMLEQLAIIFHCESHVRHWKRQKLERLRKLTCD